MASTRRRNLVLVVAIFVVLVGVAVSASLRRGANESQSLQTIDTISLQCTCDG